MTLSSDCFCSIPTFWNRQFTSAFKNAFNFFFSPDLISREQTKPGSIKAVTKLAFPLPLPSWPYLTVLPAVLPVRGSSQPCLSPPEPLLATAPHVLPTQTLAGLQLPGSTTARPCGAGPGGGWCPASRLVVLLVPPAQPAALQPSSQHLEHNLLILFLQFLCACVVSAEGFFCLFQ